MTTLNLDLNFPRQLYVLIMCQRSSPGLIASIERCCIPTGPVSQACIPLHRIQDGYSTSGHSDQERNQLMLQSHDSQSETSPGNGELKQLTVLLPERGIETGTSRERMRDFQK